MANTYSQIYIHIVFAVKGRDNLIQKNHKDELEKFIIGIVTKRNQKLLAIFCMPNHVHILIGLSPTIAISDLVRDRKAGSSKFINKNNWYGGAFCWQEGFGAFSNSRSQIDRGVKYILNQEEHHKHTSFQAEHIDFLEKYKIDYNQDYLFDWLD